jgi:hypothetical protein
VIFQLCSTEPWGLCTGEQKGIRGEVKLRFSFGQSSVAKASLKSTIMFYIIPRIHFIKYDLLLFGIFAFFHFVLYLGISFSPPVVLGQ